MLQHDMKRYIRAEAVAVSSRRDPDIHKWRDCRAQAEKRAAPGQAQIAMQQRNVIVPP